MNSKAKDVLEKIVKFAVNTAFSNYQIKLAKVQKTLEDGMVISYDDAFTVGSEVNVITVDEESKEETITLAPEGTYVVPEVGEIVVDKDGKLVSFTPIKVEEVETAKVETAEVEDIYGIQILANMLGQIDLSKIETINFKANISEGKITGWELVEDNSQVVEDELKANLSKVEDQNNEINDLKSKLEILLKTSTTKINLKSSADAEVQMTPHQARLKYLHDNK